MLDFSRVAYSVSGISQAFRLDLCVLFSIWGVLSFLSLVKKYQTTANLFLLQGGKLEIEYVISKNAIFSNYVKADQFGRSSSGALTPESPSWVGSLGARNALVHGDENDS